MKDKTRRKLKRWMKKNKKYMLVVAGVLLLALLVLVGVELYLETDRVGHALKMERFDKVQVTLEKGEDVIQLQKDGTTYYEKNDANKYYQYERDGELFLLYYDDFYGMKADNGDWVEVLVAEEDSPLSFDFSIFEECKKSDFQKVDDYYVLTEHVAEIFMDIMKIDDDSKYYGYDMKFYFAKGQMTGIVISYSYALETEIIQTYEFSYEDKGIHVPEADIKYEDTTTD